MHVCVCARARTNAALIFLVPFFVFGFVYSRPLGSTGEPHTKRARAMRIRDGIICCWNHTHTSYMSTYICIYIGCIGGIKFAG